MMEPIRPTDDLANAAAAWTNYAVMCLEQLKADEKQDVLYACFERDQSDVRVVISLRDGRTNELCWQFCGVPPSSWHPDRTHPQG